MVVRLFFIFLFKLTPKQLGVVSIDPENLSVSGLLDYIGYLDSGELVTHGGTFRRDAMRRALAGAAVGEVAK